MNFYKKIVGIPYPLLVINTNLASDIPIRFKRNL